MHVRTLKTDIQSLGGSLTYSERYALCGILGISSYDDDGEEAMKEIRKPVKKEATPDPLLELCKGLLEFDKADILDYVKYISVASKMSEEEVVDKTFSGVFFFLGFSSGCFLS